MKGFITREGVKWQFTHGVRNPSVISPDNWNNDLNHLTRKENPAIQLQLFYDYQQMFLSIRVGRDILETPAPA